MQHCRAVLVSLALLAGCGGSDSNSDPTAPVQPVLRFVPDATPQNEDVYVSVVRLPGNPTAVALVVLTNRGHYPAYTDLELRVPFPAMQFDEQYFYYDYWSCEYGGSGLTVDGVATFSREGAHELQYMCHQCNEAAELPTVVYEYLVYLNEPGEHRIEISEGRFNLFGWCDCEGGTPDCTRDYRLLGGTLIVPDSVFQ